MEAQEEPLRTHLAQPERAESSTDQALDPTPLPENSATPAAGPDGPDEQPAVDLPTTSSPDGSDPDDPPVPQSGDHPPPKAPRAALPLSQEGGDASDSTPLASAAAADTGVADGEGPTAEGHSPEDSRVRGPVGEVPAAPLPSPTSPSPTPLGDLSTEALRQQLREHATPDTNQPTATTDSPEEEPVALPEQDGRDNTATAVAPTDGPKPPRETASSGGESTETASSPTPAPGPHHGDGVGSAEATPNLRRAVERQAAIVAGALRQALLQQPPDTHPAAMPLSVEEVQRHIEHHIFNPDRSTPSGVAEVRCNFYPPFMTPKAICCYHIFATTAPIPRSCKANRSGTALLEQLRQSQSFDRLPRWNVRQAFDDGLGTQVTPVAELQEDTKLVPLRDDCSRLQWAKMRGEHLLFFSYPALHIPPKLSRMLMEVLLQPFADPEQERADVPAPSLSDQELACIVDPQERMPPAQRQRAMDERRDMVAMAVRYCAELELMQRLFREPSSVKKIQECLHHTFHQGYVQVVREVAKVNLSNYATFHGATYNSPLNNCITSKLLEGLDRADYVLDTVYLFLIMTWQTAMGMWQQAVQDTTIQAYQEAFARHRRQIYALTSVSEIASAIVDLLMNGDLLTNELRKALPDFITQSQLSHFRHFITERSNVPLLAAPFLPSDFVPLAYRESPPLLWAHVYALRLAFFLTNHGGYLHEPLSESPRDKTYCPCNLCSPHRMPQHNMALHNEMLAIDTFEIRGEDNKTFRLTPEIWSNAYIDRFVAEDYHPFTVFHFDQHESSFTKDRLACVTKTPEILDLIRRIQQHREEFLLEKGKGTYKDPVTGANLNTHASAASRAIHALGGSGIAGAVSPLALGPPPSSPHPGAIADTPRAQPSSQALPAARAHQPPRAPAPESPPRTLRAEGFLRRTDDGPTHARAEGALSGNGGNLAPCFQPSLRGRRHRRRVSRKPGYRLPDSELGGRDAGGDGAQQHSTAAQASQAAAPRQILARPGSGSAQGPSPTSGSQA
nr:100K [Tawny frogmouth aviadenovirus A]